MSPLTGLLTKTLQDCQSSQGDPVPARQRSLIREVLDTRYCVVVMLEHGGFKVECRDRVFEGFGLIPPSGTSGAASLLTGVKLVSLFRAAGWFLLFQDPLSKNTLP